MVRAVCHLSSGTSKAGRSSLSNKSGALKTAADFTISRPIIRSDIQPIANLFFALNLKLMVYLEYL